LEALTPSDGTQLSVSSGGLPEEMVRCAKGAELARPDGRVTRREKCAGATDGNGTGNILQEDML
jgi:hypothetical protein